jgi:hypothetical protein
MGKFEYCAVCGQHFSNDGFARRLVSDSWPQDQLAQFIQLHAETGVKLGDDVCDKHFKAHSLVRFSKKNFPGIELEGQGIAFVSPSKRRKPADRNVVAVEAEPPAEPARLPVEFLSIRLDTPDIAAATLGFGSTAEYEALFAELLPHVPVSAHGNAKGSARLILQLFFMKYVYAMSDALLGLFCAVNATTVGRWLAAVEDALQAWAADQVQLLSADAWETDCECLPEVFGDSLVLFVDGTVIYTEQPHDVTLQRQFYSTHKHAWGWQFFILVTPTGRIVHVSDVNPANIHDSAQFNASGVVQKLADAYGHEVANKYIECAIGGDKAYPKIARPPGWRVFVTMSAGANAEDEAIDGVFDAATTIMDPGIAGARSVIERVFARIKKYAIVEKPTSLRDDKHTEKVIRLVAALVNWTARFNNITQI